MKKPCAVLFDAYGTLFDVYSVGILAEQLFPGHGTALVKIWRDKQIDYSRLLTTCNDGAHYEPFWSVMEKALRYAIAINSALRRSCEGQWPIWFKNKAAAVQQLMNQYRHFSVYLKNREVLTELKSRGIVTGVLSNGDPAMLDIAVKSAIV
jgi:2-haloacid dehalogenase